MARSPNGGIVNGADLALDGDFFTIYTVIRQGTGDFADGTTASANTIKLAELIQQKTNMKYVAVSNGTVDLSVAGNRATYGLGTSYNLANTVISTVKFFADHKGYVTVADLEASLDGISAPVATAAVPFTSGTTGTTGTLTAYETTDAGLRNTKVISADLF